MTASISSSEIVTYYKDSLDFVGLTCHINADTVILTEAKSVNVYNASDRQTVHSFIPKTDLSFTTPVVYDYEEEKYVGIVEQTGKKKLCSWSHKTPLYNSWKKTMLMVDVTDIVPVEDGEPMVVTASHTVVFLSQYEDTKSHHGLLPDTLNDPNAKVSKLRCFKNGNKTDLIYEVNKEKANTMCILRFNGKRAAGKAQQIFTDENEITAVCRIPAQHHSYLATTADQRLIRCTNGTVTGIFKFEDNTGVKALHMLDGDQLLVAAFNTQKQKGMLSVFSLKYCKMKLLKELTSDFDGSSPLTVLSSYILAQMSNGLWSHSYSVKKLTLKSLMGQMKVTDKQQKTDVETEYMHAVKTISEALRETHDSGLEKEFEKFTHTLLVDLLNCYCNPTSDITWCSHVVKGLLKCVVLPSHEMIRVCRAAVRHKDQGVIDFIVYTMGELPEQAIVVLLSFYIKQSTGQDQMDVTDKETSETTIIPSDTAVALQALLSKDMTDVYATEAVQQMDFAQVLILLKYLSSLLSGHDSQETQTSEDLNDEPQQISRSLTEEQISKWCAVILDAHYTQLILSNQGELLVQLHDTVRQQAELQTNLLKLGAKLACKPPRTKPATGPYSIEAVAFYH